MGYVSPPFFAALKKIGETKTLCFSSKGAVRLKNPKPDHKTTFRQKKRKLFSNGILKSEPEIRQHTHFYFPKIQNKIKSTFLLFFSRLPERVRLPIPPQGDSSSIFCPFSISSTFRESEESRNSKKTRKIP